VFLGRSAARSASPAVDVAAADASAAALRGPERSAWLTVWDNFATHKPALLSLIVMSVLIISCIALPWVLPWGPTDVDWRIIAATPPSSAHPLGTDKLGRDMLARLMSAGRISLMIGLSVAFISATVGATIGTVQGYFGGATDRRLGWIVDILMTIPSLPLLIALSSIAQSPDSSIGRALGHVAPQWRMVFVMCLLGWMAISRVVRSQVVSLRKREFVEASIALGADARRVMLVHILPNTISVLAVFTTLAVSAAIMTESSLSFLGLGVQLPTATWGNMLLDARDVFTAVQYWWMAWFPALLILVSVLCVNFIGDGLRDAFDPKARW
jgi:peptide/nickel transport system permease protein